MADFCEACHLVDLNDVTLKYIFCFGVVEPLRSSLPGGTICWSLEQYIDFVLLLAGSPLTVGIVDEGLCNCSVLLLQSLITSCLPSQSVNVTHATPGPAHLTHATPGACTCHAGLSRDSSQHGHHSRASLPDGRHSRISLQNGRRSRVSCHISADLPESFPVTADIPESRHVSADCPESHCKMATTPKPHRKMAAMPDSMANMVLILQYRLPDGSSEKSSWLGWQESLIFCAFLTHRWV